MEIEGADLFMQQESLVQSQYFHLQEIAQGIYAAIIHEGQGAWANAGIIDLGDSTLVFDTFLTPAASSDLKQAAEQLFGRNVQYVVNSHWHLDHIMGNQVFTDATIISTSKTREQITSGLDLSNKDTFAQEMKAEIVELTRERDEQSEPSIIQSYQHEINELYSFVQAVPELEVTLPTITFEQELWIHGSKRSVQLLSFGGGHSVSDAFLYLPEEKIGFMGDLISVNTHPSIHRQSVPGWIEILKQVKDLNLQLLVPGHGNVGDGAQVEVVIQYLTAIYDQVVEHVQTGGTREQLKHVEMPQLYREWKFNHVFQWNLRNLFQQVLGE